MRAVTVETNSKITVVTKDTESFWESIAAQPTVKSFAFSDFQTMACATAVDMVYGEKFYSVFAATFAFAAIVINEGFSILSFLATISSVHPFRVCFCPTNLSFVILLGICL